MTGKPATVTDPDGIVHRISGSTANIHLIMDEVPKGSLMLWLHCNSDEGIVGYVDDPPKNITCLLCLMRALS